MTSTNPLELSSDRVLNPPSTIGHLECSAICHNILWKPISCRNCETYFCSTCIEQWLTHGSNQCPMRCEKFIRQPCSKLIAKLLSDLQIYCIYRSNGCNRVVPYEALENHELQCQYKPQQCSHCKILFPRKDIDTHEDICIEREFTCSDCKLIYKKKDCKKVHSELQCIKEQFRHHQNETRMYIQQLTCQIQQQTKDNDQMKAKLQKEIRDRNEELKEERHQLHEIRQCVLDHQSHEKTLQKVENDWEIYTQWRTILETLLPTPICSTNKVLSLQAKWSSNGIVVAGSCAEGKELDKLSRPRGFHIDEEQTVYVADTWNHRVIAWKKGAKSGQLVAGGNGQGAKMNQLDRPTDVVIDRKDHSILICDRGNRRVMRWPVQDGAKGKVVFNNISCCALTIDNRGYYYVSDDERHEVQRLGLGDTRGIVVAGGNGQGNGANQLNWPSYLFVGRDHSIYVSDSDNNRVMKWVEGAEEGIVVAGGNDGRNGMVTLNNPQGIAVDTMGTVYVADFGNNRIIRWPKETLEGIIVVGCKGEGSKLNQLNGPTGLSFDKDGHLYVTDLNNHRVQKFKLM